MTIKNLYASISGVTGILSIDITESFKSLSRSCTIKCTSHTLGLGDDIVVDMGYADSHAIIFTGIVKKISQESPDNSITLTCFDVLVKATDFFMASDYPQAPFSRSNIDAAMLVGDLLGVASIAVYTPIATSFIFGDVEFNLLTVADAINQINGILAYHIWADETGEVFFADRRPYVMGGDTPTHTFTTGASGNIITNSYSRSDDDLRNKVVVYGQDPIVAIESAVSPYLPTDFYKTAVIASPLITSQTMANNSSTFNLELYNRLTRNVSCEALGDPSLHVNAIVTVTETNTGVSGNWFLYNLTHSWGADGYTMRMTLRN